VRRAAARGADHAKGAFMFAIRQRGSTVGREVLGGATTFMALSYILFVQVALLGGIGMDAGGVLAALCIASAAACFLMAVLADYPIALAPGMGENFFFLAVATAMGGWALGCAGWQAALALVVASGVLFLLLSTVGIRARVLNAIPDALKGGIAAGIGLLIARVGIDHSGLPAAMRADVVRGFWGNEQVWVALIGLGATLLLLAVRLRGAILLGIAAATAASLALGRTSWQFPFETPSGLADTAGGCVAGFRGLWTGLTGGRTVDVIAFLLVLVMLDLFDTVGTLVGVARPAGLMQAGRLPRAARALAADAAGTTIGGLLGSSTITSYVESITGVQAGARTGLASVVTGVLLLAAMFCGPLIDVVLGDFGGTGAGRTFPTLAAALIVVGAMMLRSIRELDWDDVTEYLPAFLAVVVMPLTHSIAAGIAAGFVGYAFAKLVSGRPRECPALVYVFAVLWILRYVLY